MTKNSKKLTAIAFAENERANYFSKMAYSENPRRTDLGKSVYERLEPLVENLKPDIVFVDTHFVFSDFLFANDFFILPYLQYSIDISGSLDSVLQLPRVSKTTEKEIRRLSKNKLTYRLTRDPATLKEFYYCMYVPQVLERHKEDAKLVSLKECMRLANTGWLMLLILNGSVISAAVCVPKDEILYVPIVGINFAHQGRKIAVSALTYFIIKWAKQKGFATLDCGASKPFLRDGVVFFKRRWGMSVEPMKTPDARICAIKFCNFHDAVRNFVQNNPFVFADGVNLYSLVFSSSPTEDIRKYCTPGISGLVTLKDGHEASLHQIQVKAPLTNIFKNCPALVYMNKVVCEAGTEMSYVDFKCNSRE